MRNLKKRLQILVPGLYQLFFPAVCINCGRSIRESDNGLCTTCWDELRSCTGGDYCPGCGKDVSKYALLADACPDCQSRQIHFDRIARSGFYADAMRKMILALKNGKTELDTILVFLADSALKGSGFCDDVDFFVPVPLHWRRKLTRGYNQSLVIAKKLRDASAKTNTDLVRIRNTKLQTSMISIAAREKNVAGAFAVRREHPFNGKNVCLVDDIKTTGATLNECAKILKQAGASKVFALVLAVAGQNLG